MGVVKVFLVDGTYELFRQHFGAVRHRSESSLTTAATVGVLTPLTLSRLKFDPAVSSAVFVTATTDFFGFLIFLGLASIVLL